MPIIRLGDGRQVSVPEAFAGRDAIRLPRHDANMGHLVDLYHLCGDGIYRTADQMGAGLAPPAIEERPIPAFDGWEYLPGKNFNERSDKGTYVAVCISPSQRDYGRYSTPEDSLNYNGSLNMGWGCSLGVGWALYRKKLNFRPAGQIRLMPSSHFSQPLPLP